ncbi:MAG: uracil permease [Spirochaetes bacterium GWD1_61_31]|nr:MAG: uracil permease [Spirochaetes bacterium GWB1_60_80]OHD35169.1 MAG: uracil permease [Spirochaetes bacterium GWC1_61_12]OHD43102.1 MAG: uracil permease [Spirochaetes bacterium GWE1_60_18]OHD43525.1 MAG: uracil permease [Spirochaetes bacterium GWD1_61_31]OHD59696.1 MAG: uracil permease [Spirochaetes bacterium GWF1_60_12]HAP44092.1 uracil permease [Spirochaetaceae bacterium]
MAESLNEPINGKTVVLGLQHTFVMFGATVLVPILTGLDISVTLFAAGIGTWLFHIITKFKVPVFLGSSFAFIPGLVAVGASQGLPYALGGIVVAGLLYVVVAIIFKFISYENLHKILPTHVTGPMIILIGLILAPVAIQNANGTYSAPLVEAIGVNGCWGLALFTFAVGIFVKIAFKKFGWKFLSNLPVLISLVAGYALAIALGLVDFTAVREAAWIGIPHFTLPKFSLEAITVMVPIAIVTMVEHFGDVLAIGNVVNRDFIKDPGIHRTLIGDGLATSLSALIGGPANTTYSENTGAVALTGAFNPWIMRIAACFAIVLAMIPKFTAIIGTIPGPVIGGISILLFGMISSIGVKNMVDAKVNLGNPKILIITAAMLVLGLGGAAFKFGNINLSGLGLAAIFGIVLNVILRPKTTDTND